MSTDLAGSCDGDGEMSTLTDQSLWAVLTTSLSEIKSYRDTYIDAQTYQCLCLWVMYVIVILQDPTQGRKVARSFWTWIYCLTIGVLWIGAWYCSQTWLGLSSRAASE
ncbi:hypothetical protein QBC37DRAFT_142701 [Rhypophila decipiens]|uniref:Uncharacterized protein n=1 Tax=Rhypophila decipiens TaxID=261697 RepID=A0AAN6YEU6_9PEZI|nr:hypothetical protein QBC37DRAFT_142701 [Rhypophila decipiens]